MMFSWMFSAVRGRGGVRACDPASANRAIIAGNWQTANGRGNMPAGISSEAGSRPQPPRAHYDLRRLILLPDETGL